MWWNRTYLSLKSECDRGLYWQELHSCVSASFGVSLMWSVCSVLVSFFFFFYCQPLLFMFEYKGNKKTPRSVRSISYYHTSETNGPPVCVCRLPMQYFETRKLNSQYVKQICFFFSYVNWFLKRTRQPATIIWRMPIIFLINQMNQNSICSDVFIFQPNVVSCH